MNEKTKLEAKARERAGKLSKTWKRYSSGEIGATAMRNEVQRTAEELWMNPESDAVIRPIVKTTPGLGREVKQAEQAIERAATANGLWRDRDQQPTADSFIKDSVRQESSNPYMRANLNVAAENEPGLQRFIGAERKSIDVQKPNTRNLDAEDAIRAWDYTKAMALTERLVKGLRRYTAKLQTRGHGRSSSDSEWER